MKRGFINPSVRRKAGLRRNAFIFIMCFGISAFIWALIKLSKEYAEVFTYSVNYKGLPANKQLANYPDTVFNITLKQKGFKVLMHKLSSKSNNIEIDISNKLHPFIKEKNNFYVLTSELFSQINSQISSASSVVAISPDTIKYHFDRTVTRKVPVKPLFELSFEKQYNLSGKIKLVPESLIVKGPKNIVDTLNLIASDIKKLSDINKSQIITVHFEKFCKEYRTSIEPDYVKAFIPVDKYTESTIEIPVIVKNAPPKYNIKSLPEKVKIIYLVGLRDYKKVKPEMFTVFVDYTKAKDFMIKVEISEKPEFVKVSKIVPEKIEYILF